MQCGLDIREIFNDLSKTPFPESSVTIQKDTKTVKLACIIKGIASLLHTAKQNGFELNQEIRFRVGFSGTFSQNHIRLKNSKFREKPNEEKNKYLEKMKNQFDNWLKELTNNWVSTDGKNPRNLSISKYNFPKSDHSLLTLLTNTAISSKMASILPISITTPTEQSVTVEGASEDVKKFYSQLISLRISFSKLDGKLKASSFAFIHEVPKELHSIMGLFIDLQTTLQARLICQATNTAFLKVFEIEKSASMFPHITKAYSNVWLS